MLILMRVSMTSPLVAKAFAAQCLEDQIKQEDLQAVYEYIVVSFKSTTTAPFSPNCAHTHQLSLLQAYPLPYVQ